MHSPLAILPKENESDNELLTKRRPGLGHWLLWLQENELRYLASLAFGALSGWEMSLWNPAAMGYNKCDAF